MGARDYWEECLAQSLEDNGVAATQEQIRAIAADVQSGHENYGLAFYQPTGPSDAERDLKETQRLLREERAMVTCKECGGSGEYVSHGPIHRAYGQCFKCKGHGRHAP